MPVGEHPCKTAALNMGSLLRGQRSYRVNDCMHTWQNLPFHLPLPHPQRTSERGLSLLSGFSSICCTTSAEQSRAAARMFPKALRDPAGGLASQHYRKTSAQPAPPSWTRNTCVWASFDHATQGSSAEGQESDGTGKKICQYIRPQRQPHITDQFIKTDLAYESRLCKVTGERGSNKTKL